MKMQEGAVPGVPIPEDGSAIVEPEVGFELVPTTSIAAAQSMPLGTAVSAVYRNTLRIAVTQARTFLRSPLDRRLHWEAIAPALGQQFDINSRSVTDNLRALDAEADLASAYVPEIEWLGLDDRDRLASAMPRYLVTDYLFADGAIHVVYGAPASRKTFLALSWLLGVATNRPWAGRYPVQPGGALLFAGEAPATLRVRRMAALAALGVTPEMAGALPFGVVPELPPLGMADGVEAALRLIETHYYKRFADVPLRLIGFDTLTRLSQRAAASTTDPKEYGVLLDRVEQIARATGASILLLAHSPEGNPEKPTGTYQTRANADSVMKIERVDNQSSLLTVEKAKDDIESAPLLLQFERVDVRPWLADSYKLQGQPFPGPLAAALKTDAIDLPTDEKPTEQAEVPVSATQEAALRRQFTSLVLTEARQDKSREVGRGSRESQVEQQVLNWLSRHPGASQRELRDSLGGRADQVNKALARLLDRGAVEDRGSRSRRAYHLQASPKSESASETTQ